MIQNVPPDVCFPVRKEPLLFIADSPEEKNYLESGMFGIIETNQEKEVENCVGVVGGRYDLVPNQFLLDALNEATEEIGLNLLYKPELSGRYVSGKKFNRFYMSFESEDTFKAGPDDISVGIELKNSYDGTSRWGINSFGQESKLEENLVFVVRRKCVNGLLITIHLRDMQSLRDTDEFVGIEKITNRMTRRENVTVTNALHVEKYHTTVEQMVDAIQLSFEQTKLGIKYLEMLYNKKIKFNFETFVKLITTHNNADGKLFEEFIKMYLGVNDSFTIVQAITWWLTHVMIARNIERQRVYAKWFGEMI